MITYNIKMFVKKLPAANAADAANAVNAAIYTSYIDKFTNLKTLLNNEKSNFNKISSLKEYERVLKLNNPYYEMIQILKEKLNNPYITNAYIKMRELLIYFKNKFNFVNSMHVAEFPGSFIVCIGDYCKENNIQYSWLANSYKDEKGKNSYYLHDTFKLYEKYPNNWLFGAFNNGDITRLDNIRSIKQDILQRNAMDVATNAATNVVSFLTGDAKVILTNDENGKSPNWDNEEQDNANVIYSETLLALTLLSIGGSAIIKFFTFCNKETIYIIYNISKYFNETYITKPITSRPANDEVYLVCLNKNKDFDEEFLYQVIDSPFIQFPDNLKVPDEFIKFLYEIEEELINKQIDALKFNLSLKIVEYDKKIIDDWMNVNKI